MSQVTREILDRLWPTAPIKLKDGFIVTKLPAFELGQIRTPLRLAHFMAQISHESSGGTTMEENLSYTATRMMQVWPSRFRTLQAAKPFAHNPKALANKVYNGRLGNRPDSDDGFWFRGRGYIQLTGRDNYKTMSHITGQDLMNSPDRAALPEYALIIAAGVWKRFGCNPSADVDDVVTVTKLINGGTIGLPSRREWLKRWKKALEV